MRSSNMAVLFFLSASLLGHTSSSSAQDFTVQSTIRVGASPQYAAISHDGSRLFVANTGADTVTAINTRNGSTLKQLTVGKNPHGLLLSHDGRRLYVIIDRNDPPEGGCFAQSPYDVAIVVVDTAELSIIRTIPFEGRTDALALTPDDKQLYMARVCNEIDTLDLSALESQPQPSLVARKNPGGYPVGILISPDGRDLFVNYQGGGPNSDSIDYTIAHDALVEYDLSSGNIVRLQHSLPNVGDQIVLSPNGEQVWSNGVDACSRPDYDHAGCPSVPSDVVSALRVSDNAQTTLTPLKTFGFTLLDTNGRISISPQGDVLIGGGISLKRIDPRTLQVVQKIEIAGAGDAVFSPDGQTAYVTARDKNEVVVLARGKPANPEVQPEVAALPLSVVDSVLLQQNCRQGEPCDVCAKSGSNCTPETTPSQLQGHIPPDVLIARGSQNGPGQPVFKPAETDNLPCGLHFDHEQLTDSEANRLLAMVYFRDASDITDFEHKTSTSSTGTQLIDAKIGSAMTVGLFQKILDQQAVYLTTIVCQNRVQTALFQQRGANIVATALHDNGKPYTRDEVRALVKVFLDELKNPCSDQGDIRKTGQALYNIIFPPDILKVIGSRDTQNLVWGLSDALRLIPMGALWDGNEFLEQHYGNSLWTASSNSNRDRADDFMALAAGDTNPDGSEHLPTLPSVKDEIFNTFTPVALSDKGKIPATILLDDGKLSSTSPFTSDNLKAQLQALGDSKQSLRRIVHLSSHFIINSSDRDSYLLTASEPSPSSGHTDPRKLSLSDLSDDQNFDFHNIWLVTLSACETGVGVSTSDGREVQSFASVADASGAESTLATLWVVYDTSTSTLMHNFYLQLRLGQEKGAALRLAQDTLRTDTHQITYNANDSTGKSCPTTYSHPHFWAPFVLIGSWH